MGDANRDEYSLMDLVLKEAPDDASDEVSVEPAAAPPSAPPAQSGVSQPNVEDSAGAATARRRQSPFSIGAANSRTLRRAIIWSEIIGPPVALRDSTERHR